MKYVVFLLFMSCSSIDAYPRRACLYDGAKRFNAGVVIAQREDGARLFRFDDPTQGDHGFRWIEDGDRSLGPCRGGDIQSAEEK